MFFYIETEKDAKKLYDLFVEIYNNKEYKNLNDKELYELVQKMYFEKYMK